MAAFLGEVQGARGPCSRLGHTELRTVAASWAGAISVYLWKDDAGETRFEVQERPWHGKGRHKLLASGVMGAD